jgi:hypothetical protein
MAVFCLAERVEGLLDELLALGVKGGGRLIEEGDVRICEDRPGNADALLLFAERFVCCVALLYPSGSPMPRSRTFPTTHQRFTLSSLLTFRRNEGWKDW